jgi:hypothetical protein
MPAAFPSAVSRTDPVVVVPVYRPVLSPIEGFTLAWSLGRLARRRRVVLTGPEGLDLGHYRDTLGSFDWLPFGAASFASIPGYSRLLTSHAFHDAFADHGFLLVLQTDALLLHDDLDDWCAAPFDYVGAPWPAGVEILLQLDRFAAGGGQRVKAHVGNGGFSLRRVRACRALLDEFPQALAWFQQSGSSEDLFFALMGSVSDRFVLPNPFAAARFSRELQPRLYHAVHQAAPTGGHAWWKHDAGYWLEQIGRLDATAREHATALVDADAASRRSSREAAPMPA